jgi:putative phosphoesterase
MRIAVIADTHDRYPRQLPGLLKGADEIWHLGDVCDPATLGEITALGRPLLVILGNNDANPSWPLVLRLEREQIKFYLVHVPPARPPTGCQVVLHGHTHVPRDETLDKIRWLNPGCISRPNRGSGASFAWLTVAHGRIERWDLVSL